MCFLNYLGALFGIGISNLAVYATVLSNKHNGPGSAVSRFIPAIFLALTALTGALLLTSNAMISK
jgi:hypothetical protein